MGKPLSLSNGTAPRKKLKIVVIFILKYIGCQKGTSNPFANDMHSYNLSIIYRGTPGLQDNCLDFYKLFRVNWFPGYRHSICLSINDIWFPVGVPETLHAFVVYAFYMELTWIKLSTNWSWWALKYCFAWINFPVGPNICLLIKCKWFPVGTPVVLQLLF